MTQLALLRSQLQSLRTARAAVQWGSALAATVSAMLALWLAAWGLDAAFRWDPSSRLVLLVGWLAAIAMLLHRWFRPLLHPQESLEQVALWVETRHRLDGDLISALQFERPAARTWGSPRLTSAVVEYVADFSRGLNVFDGFTWESLPRRLVLLSGLMLVWTGLLVTMPLEAAAFWNRFWLGTARYPTRTVLARVTINGREVEPFVSGKNVLAVAQDEPLVVELSTSGEEPEGATIVVRGLRSAERGQFPMTTDKDGLFRYLQPALSESLRLWIRAGDAESDAIDIAIVPLPLVDLRWSVEPPAYARSAGRVEIPAGTRSFAVLAGSRVTCTVSSVNKPLESVALKIDGETLPFAAGTQQTASVWTNLPHSRLVRLQQPFTYELPVVDRDGLSPRPAIAGDIRLQTDRPPRVSAAAISRKVLPQAQPRITYGATDDFGLGELRVEWEVIAESGMRRSDHRVLRPRDSRRPVDSLVRGETVFELSALEVSPGDEVRVTIAADDERGEFPSQTGRSEPVIFSITDKAGILESLLEIDQQSAKQLEAIIEKELGIGGVPR